MAEQMIEEVYYYADIASKLRCVVNRIREGDRNHALILLESILPNMEKLLNECILDGYEEAGILKDNLLSINEMQDMVFLGDMLEGIVIPIIERWIQSWVSVCEQMNDRYVIETTSSGFLTIKDTIADKYLHSNNDPMDEARRQVEKQYLYDIDRYLIWGSGLGYQAYQLYQYSQGTIPIILYEPDTNMVNVAKKYGVLSWIPDSIIQIKSPCSAEDYLNSIRGTDGLLFLLPYINCMRESQSKHMLMEKYVLCASNWENLHFLKMNFNRNKELELPDISKIDELGINDEFVIVGGGPSVDDNIDILKEWKGYKTIIAVGTIWKKLLKEGIQPDYVVFLDPTDLVYVQASGVKDTTSTLLISLTGYWKVAREYVGKKYTVCVDSPGCDLKDYAKNHGVELWESGGTVVALAIDIAIRFCAKKIYMVGVDLAFLGGFSHAEGTADRQCVDLKRLKRVKCNNGELGYTDDAFTLYRYYLEHRIANNKGIKFINMSENGAVITGTLTYKEYLSQTNGDF